MGRSLTLTETLMANALAVDAEVQPASWEIGRLVLLPAWRLNPDALRRCLYLATDYLCRNAEANSLYASCSHVLSRLYRRFGFTAFAREVTFQGAGKTYSLIRGDASRVLSTLMLAGLGAAAC